MQLIIKHNIEIAHRLSLTPGKCQNIHGHSMQVEIHLEGWLVDETGKMNGIELGALKDTIRGHLNKEYDHHLLLNVDDPWLRSLRGGLPETPELLPPGFKGRSGDPTTENIAAWIYDELEFMLPLWKSLQVVIHETATNSVVYP